MIGFMVGNVGLWPAKTLEWRRVTQDSIIGGLLEMLTIAKLITIEVLLHQFSNINVSFTLCACQANKFHSESLIIIQKA